MAERSGIEIDYCPQCRGVWLDRGELDKIIERNATLHSFSGKPGDVNGRNELKWEKRKDHPSPYADDYKRKKRKNLLDELFDF